MVGGLMLTILQMEKYNWRGKKFAINHAASKRQSQDLNLWLLVCKIHILNHSTPWPFLTARKEEERPEGKMAAWS